MSEVAHLSDYRPQPGEDVWRAEVNLAAEAEQGLLGGLFLYPDSFPAVSGLIKPAYFAHPVHGLIFDAFAHCRRAGIRATLAEMRQAIGAKGLASDMGAGVNLAEYIVNLSQEGATSRSTVDYARAVRAHWALRQLHSSTVIGDAAGLPEDKVKSAFDRIDALRTELAEAGAERSQIGAIAERVLQRSIAISNGEVEEPGLTTGILDLDRAILGFRPGEMIILAGRPGMGKTTVGTALALNASNVRLGARRAGVALFALEMGEEAIGARCLSDLAYDRYDGPTHSAIRAGHLTAVQIDRLREAECLLNERELEVDHRSSITVGEIEATCHAIQRRLEQRGVPLGLIIVDQLKQVRATERYRGQRVYEIAEITAGLKDIAKRFGACVVLLAQLNRGVESREDKRPTLADLRESGDLENDADVVLLLYREAYYLRRDIRSADPEQAVSLEHKLEQVQHELEIIAAKNRNGEGEHTVHLFCDIGRSAVRALAKGAAT